LNIFKEKIPKKYDYGEKRYRLPRLHLKLWQN